MVDNAINPFSKNFAEITPFSVNLEGDNFCFNLPPL